MACSKAKLYNAWFCPFAQRAWIGLLHKQVDFEYVEQNPYNKTPEWLAICPTGLVPAIVHNNRTIYESGICLEYIDEAWPAGPQILPEDAFSRAYVRMWCDRLSKKFVPQFYVLLLKQDKETQKMARDNILNELVTLTGAMTSGGPFFMGKEFGMFDIMLVPFALRFYILKHFRDFEVPEESKYDRFREWLAAVEALQCCKLTIADPQQLIQSYQRYADGDGKSQVSEAIKKGTSLP